MNLYFIYLQFLFFAFYSTNTCCFQKKWVTVLNNHDLNIGQLCVIMIFFIIHAVALSINLLTYVCILQFACTENLHCMRLKRSNAPGKAQELQQWTEAKRSTRTPHSRAQHRRPLPPAPRASNHGNRTTRYNETTIRTLACENF